MTDDRSCEPVEFDPYYYMAAEQVNLTDASITTGKEEHSLLGEALYSVTGDDNTWVGNGSLSWNHFHFQWPTDFTVEEQKLDCVRAFKVTWFVGSFSRARSGKIR
jgi:hypothetical protein